MKFTKEDMIVIIKKKINITKFLEDVKKLGFCGFKFSDENGPQGCITEIYYLNGWNIFSEGPNWYDQQPTSIEDAKIIDWVWKNRKSINREIKRKKQEW